jgi:hypothetical protein
MGGEPIGTGFIVVKDNEFGGRPLAYVVTAAHLVTNNYAAAAMRLRTIAGGVHDFPLGTWAMADDDDVAAQECDFWGFEPPVEFNAYILDEAIDKKPLKLRSGEQCYFIGLLERVPSMGPAMIPMLRSGALGAYMQKDVPIKVEPPKSITAHLIDGRSLGGFSGSPCFVQITAWLENEKAGHAPIPQELTRLIGIVVAHYDDIEREAGVKVAKLNTGVAIVLPVERVRALIEGDDELMKKRRKRAVESGPDIQDATLDSVDRQSDTIGHAAGPKGKLLQVPKAEADAAHRRHGGSRG